MTEAEWWTIVVTGAGVGVAAVGVVVSAYYARDAAKQARVARQDADEALAVQLRDEQRREVDGELQREADAVLAAAKAQWPQHWHTCETASVAGRPRGKAAMRIALSSVSSGVVIKRELPAREDVAARLARHESVASAHAHRDGYRVVLKFDREDPGRVL